MDREITYLTNADIYMPSSFFVLRFSFLFFSSLIYSTCIEIIEEVSSRSFTEEEKTRCQEAKGCLIWCGCNITHSQ